MHEFIVSFALLLMLAACEQKVQITLPQNPNEGREDQASSASASSGEKSVYTTVQLADLPVPETEPKNMSEKEEYAYWEKTLSQQAGHQEAKKNCEAKNKKYILKLEKNRGLLSTSTSIQFECQ